MGAKAYRGKTRVLCFFEYLGRDERGTRRLTDSLMVEVEFSDQIEASFELAMKRRVATWGVGPRPMEWTLLRYLTARGEQRF